MAEGGSVEINYATIRDSVAFTEGGAIFNNGSVNIFWSIIENNQSTAITNNGLVDIESSTLRNNAGAAAGMLQNRMDAISNLRSSAVLNNQALDNDIGDGGAIYNDFGGTVNITSVTFEQNRAQNSGGAIRNFSGGNVTINRSSFNNNTATTGEGGAIATRFSAGLTISNSTFTNNTAINGGAIANGGNASTFTFLTIAQNTATTGGGIFNVENFGLPTLTNSILSANTGGNCAGPIDEVGGNIDDGNSCGFDVMNDSLINTNPLLEQFDGVAFPLQQNSPAIDAAPSCAGFDEDQLGFTRPNGTACDIGALEYILVPDPPIRNYPEPGATLGNGNADWPPFTFQHFPGVEWYQIWIGTDESTNYGTTSLYQWYPAFDTSDSATPGSGICNEQTNICTIPTDIWLPDGSYSWWMTYWTPGDTLNTINLNWTETTFNVDFLPPEATLVFTNPTDNQILAAEPDLITWARDTDVLWYHFWIGTADYQTTVYFGWQDATEICDASVCTFNVNTFDFPNDNYEIWTEVWGPAGFLNWNAVNSGQSSSFTVNSN